MKSYKCQQCGFVSLATQTHCKNCQTPNPNPVTGFETFTGPTQFSAPPPPTAPSYQTPAAEYSQPPAAVRENSYYSPPPPTSFGNEYGTAYNTGAPPRREHPLERFRTPSTLDYSMELEDAEADIRKGWKAGRAWCILIGILGAIISSVVLFASPSPFIVLIPVFIIGAFITVIGGLSYGVFLKSRVCAVILLALVTLSVINNLLELTTQGGRAAIALLISLLFFYYFFLGVRGTFKYHKLMKA